ncbi:MAG: hypothetical protein WC364_04760 [Eubacteriales bacterium]
MAIKAAELDGITSELIRAAVSPDSYWINLMNLLCGEAVSTMSEAEIYVIATVLRILNQDEAQRLEAKLDEMAEEDYAGINLRTVS